MWTSRDEILSRDMISKIDTLRLTKRNKEIIKKYANGQTMEQLAIEYGVSLSVVKHAVDTIIIQYNKTYGKCN